MATLAQLCDAASLEQSPVAVAPAAIQVLEVDAFASVHDLIHSAVEQNGGAATLKDIYDVCRTNGRIAYKRAGGSRLIITNDHWKSQIRHALYTSERFQRVPGSGELWQMMASWIARPPAVVRVLVRADEAENEHQPLPSRAPSGATAITTTNNNINNGRSVSGAQQNNSNLNRQQQSNSARGNHHRKRSAADVLPARYNDDNDDDPDYSVENRRGSAPPGGNGRRKTSHQQRSNNNNATTATNSNGDCGVVLPTSGSAPALFAMASASEFISPPSGSEVILPRSRLRFSGGANDGITPLPYTTTTTADNGGCDIIVSARTPSNGWKDPSELRWGATLLRSNIVISPNDDEDDDTDDASGVKNNNDSIVADTPRVWVPAAKTPMTAGGQAPPPTTAYKTRNNKASRLRGSSGGNGGNNLMHQLQQAQSALAGQPPHIAAAAAAVAAQMMSVPGWGDVMSYIQSTAQQLQRQMASGNGDGGVGAAANSPFPMPPLPQLAAAAAAAAQAGKGGPAGSSLVVPSPFVRAQQLKQGKAEKQKAFGGDKNDEAAAAAALPYDDDHQLQQEHGSCQVPVGGVEDKVSAHPGDMNLFRNDDDEEKAMQEEGNAPLEGAATIEQQQPLADIVVEVEPTDVAMEVEEGNAAHVLAAITTNIGSGGGAAVVGEKEEQQQ